MNAHDTAAHEDVCGTKLVRDRPRVNPERRYDPDTWYETNDGVYCARGVWDSDETDRCIWHADVVDKPEERLVAEWSGEPMRLDRAVLRGLDLRDRISFADCRLIEADFSETNLFDADLAGANLRGATLADANLEHATLSGVEAPESKFQRADLTNATVKDAVFRGAAFTDAKLHSAKLHNTEFRQADFDGAVLVNSKLPGADLSNGYLSECNLRGATLTDAVLERAIMTRANLFGATFTGAKLYGAVLADVQLDTQTTFGDHYTDSYDPDKAAWMYRQLEQVFRENAFPERAREAYFNRKDLRRQQHWAEGDYGQAVLAAGYGATMRYGESPGRVVGISVTTVVVSALLYPLSGLTVEKANASSATLIAYPFDSVGVLTGLGKSLYFSMITFTTLGYGDVQPLGFGEALATLESFLGALLMALLVFVLGRRATW